MRDDNARVIRLLETLNESERRGRMRAASASSAASAVLRGDEELSRLVDREKSGVFSNDSKSFCMTLTAGTIIGRGLFGDGPLRDLPGAVNSRTWRVWSVQWKEEKLECLRCGHEWRPSRQGCPEQCPSCLGILSKEISADNAAERGSARKGWFD